MCNKVYGYARVSTDKQNIERQIRNIKAAFPEALIVKEAFTGTKIEGRTEFVKLMKAVKAGDTIVFDSVSRMSRNAEDGFTLYKDCYSKGIELVFLKEPHINTSTYKQEVEREFGKIETGDRDTDDFVNEMLDVVTRYIMRLAERQIKLAFKQSEKEVMDMRQRTREGIETARLNGKQIGQEKGRKLVVKKAGKAKQEIIKYSKAFGGSLNDEEVMKLVGISRPTYYKYKKEIAEEMERENAEKMQGLLEGEFIPE